MATRKEALVKLFLLISSIKQATAFKLSTACAARDEFSCTRHNLRCPDGNAISIHRGWYGYIHLWDSCSRPELCDDRNCCGFSKEDIFSKFTEYDMNELKSTCTGHNSCLFTSPYHRTRRFSLSRYVYSIIRYYCVPILNLTDTSGTNTINNNEVFVKASPSHKGCSCTVSSDTEFTFYQTSESCFGVVTDRGIAKCNILYGIDINNEDPFALQFILNITDVVVNLQSDVKIKVNCSCDSPIDVFSSTEEMKNGNFTIDNSTLIPEIFNASRRVISSNDSGIGSGGIAGIVIGSLFFIIIIAVVIVILVVRRRGSEARSKEASEGVVNYSYEFAPEQQIPRNETNVVQDYEKKGGNPQNTYNHVGMAESDDGYNHIGNVTKSSDVIDSGNDYNHIA